MIGKSILVFKSILFYFDIPMPMITTLSETHNACIALSHAWLICKLSPDTIGLYGDTVGLYAHHLTYEIHHHYSPMFVTMYTYVH